MRKFLGVMLFLFALVLFGFMFLLQREAVSVMPSAPLVFGWGKYVVAIPLVLLALKFIKGQKAEKNVPSRRAN